VQQITFRQILSQDARQDIGCLAFGTERHGQTDFSVWLHGKLIKNDLRNCGIGVGIGVRLHNDVIRLLRASGADTV
jgi:hypothetical protein